MILNFFSITKKYQISVKFEFEDDRPVPPWWGGIFYSQIFQEKSVTFVKIEADIIRKKWWRI